MKIFLNGLLTLPLIIFVDHVWPTSDGYGLIRAFGIGVWMGVLYISQYKHNQYFDEN